MFVLYGVGAGKNFVLYSVEAVDCVVLSGVGVGERLGMLSGGCGENFWVPVRRWF